MKLYTDVYSTYVYCIAKLHSSTEVRGTNVFGSVAAPNFFPGRFRIFTSLELHNASHQHLSWSSLQLESTWSSLFERNICLFGQGTKISFENTISSFSCLGNARHQAGRGMNREYPSVPGTWLMLSQGQAHGSTVDPGLSQCAKKMKGEDFQTRTATNDKKNTVVNKTNVTDRKRVVGLRISQKCFFLLRLISRWSRFYEWILWVKQMTTMIQWCLKN